MPKFEISDIPNTSITLAHNNSMTLQRHGGNHVTQKEAQMIKKIFNNDMIHNPNGSLINGGLTNALYVKKKKIIN